jgi:hypothetical protein
MRGVRIGIDDSSERLARPSSQPIGGASEVTG